MGWTLVAVLAVNLAALAASLILLRGWLERRLSATRQAADLGDEVGRLVVELNQASERNVVLLEDRVAALNDLLAAADKKIGLLRREIERHEAGVRVYGQLAAPSARVAAAADVAGLGGERAPAGGTPKGAGAGERSAVADANPKGGDGRPAGPLEGTPAAPDARTARRSEIGRLARAGLQASTIAARVGVPLGEVELILSLEQRARES